MQFKDILGCLEVYMLYSGFLHHLLESLISTMITMVSIGFPMGFHILSNIKLCQVDFLELCGG